ncbi:MAG: protein-glutamate O-methyltransferase CheR [Polyangiaceae bacterium]
MRKLPSIADGIGLKPDEFRLLRDLFAAHTGLSFAPETRFALERRLRERLVVLKLSSFAEYHRYLRFNPRADEEWDEAIDALTTNETYFFREDRQLRAFQQELLPILCEQVRAERRLILWSAGCSTGEEAYTIAILLHQSGLFYPRRRLTSGSMWPRLASPGAEEPLSWDVRVYGSDISRRCVSAARRGVFGESSFRATPPELRDAFFEERPDGWHVVDPIRQVCHFAQMNLLDDRSRLLGRADAIFCRNVLIYFDSRARKLAIEKLYERLNPGGVLLLGHSESLLNVSTAFELLHLKEDLVYRRPLTTRISPTLDEST